MLDEIMAGLPHPLTENDVFRLVVRLARHPELRALACEFASLAMMEGGERRAHHLGAWAVLSTMLDAERLERDLAALAAAA